MHRADTIAVSTASPLGRTNSSDPRHRPPRILLRSSWQTVNIGDVGHTPGALALIERHIPDAEVILWASADLPSAIASMFHERFPNLLKVVKGKVDQDGVPANRDVSEAQDWADFLLHGSSASVGAGGDVAQFVRSTGKPFGVYGVTYGSWLASGNEKEILDQAAFAFFRDSVSLEKARSDGVRCPIMGFSPDAAFAVDIRDDAAATTFLAKHDLERERFLVVIPRWRYTPYWKIRHGRKPESELERQRWARNQEMKAADQAKLREAAVAFVRKTGMKLLVCPEDMSQMELGKEQIVDKLPEDVRSQTVWRERFWSVEEAVAVHAQAFALLSLDMHSPIMALNHGIPSIVCRFEEQTSKGFMWRDIGLGDWLFNLDTEVDGTNITDVLLAIAADRDRAQTRAAQAWDFVRERQQESMSVLAQVLEQYRS